MKKIGRNDPCHCGSGKKYKKCCLEKDEKERYLKTLNKLNENIEDSAESSDELEENESYIDSEDVIENEELNNYSEETEDNEDEKNVEKYACKKFEENIPEISAEKHDIIDIMTTI